MRLICPPPYKIINYLMRSEGRKEYELEGKSTAELLDMVRNGDKFLNSITKKV